MNRTLMAFALATVIPAYGLAQMQPTPGSVDASIRLHGAKDTIATLAQTDQWDIVADKIGDGRADWIGLAPKLAVGSDAGSSEDLGIALAFSLPRNARAVLAVLDPANGIVLGANRVCGMPFIEDTVNDRSAYKTRTLRAVENVSSPRLDSAKAACLKALQNAR